MFAPLDDFVFACWTTWVRLKKQTAVPWTNILDDFNLGSEGQVYKVVENMQQSCYLLCLRLGLIDDE